MRGDSWEKSERARRTRAYLGVPGMDIGAGSFVFTLFWHLYTIFLAWDFLFGLFGSLKVVGIFCILDGLGNMGWRGDIKYLSLFLWRWTLLFFFFGMLAAYLAYEGTQGMGDILAVGMEIDFLSLFFQSHSELESLCVSLKILSVEMGHVFAYTALF